jgi:two-component system CheB/CheR fusion protein
MEFVAPRKRDMVAERIRRVLEHGEVVGYETDGDPDVDPNWYAVRVAPIRDDGRIRGLTMILTNITEAKETERTLQRERDFIDAVLETAGALVVVLDREGTIVRFNRACEQATGYDAEKIVGEKIWERLLPPEEVEAVRDVFRALRDEHLPNAYENHWVTRSGGRLLIAWSNTVITDAEGEVDYIIGTGLDVTERRRAERRQLRMMQELDHRVKNNLAAVLALAEQSMTQAATMEDVRDSFIGRVRALAVTHEALAAARWEGVDFDRVARQILAPYMYDGRTGVHLDGASVMLPARASSPVCMTLHELSTNAAKYGALSVPGGRIDLSWRAEDDETLRITWIETGGPPADRARDDGFGTKLIRGAIEHEVRGRVEMEFRPEGLVCRIDVPLVDDQDFALHAAHDEAEGAGERG